MMWFKKAAQKMLEYTESDCQIASDRTVLQVIQCPRVGSRGLFMMFLLKLNCIGPHLD
jgi:hypothetical protein